MSKVTLEELWNLVFFGEWKKCVAEKKPQEHTVTVHISLKNPNKLVAAAMRMLFFIRDIKAGQS